MGRIRQQVDRQVFVRDRGFVDAAGYRIDLDEVVSLLGRRRDRPVAAQRRCAADRQATQDLNDASAVNWQKDPLELRGAPGGYDYFAFEDAEGSLENGMVERFDDGLKVRRDDLIHVSTAMV